MSIPVVEPMAATLASSLPVGPQWSYEVKWDGYRALLLRDGSRTKLVSRNLKDLTADYPHIAAAAASLPASVLLDGEIVALDEHGLPTFQALQHRSVKRTAVVFYAFDLLHLGAASYLNRPLRDRRAALAELTFASPLLLSQPLPGCVCGLVQFPFQVRRKVR